MPSTGSRYAAYEKVGRESLDSESLLRQDRHERGGLRYVSSAIRGGSKGFVAIAMLFLIMLLLLIFGGVLLSRTWKPSLSQITISTFIPPNYCGSTPAEAKAAGCAFELNNFAWMHPDCYDEELDKDWTDGPLAGQLEFWEQYNGTGAISKDLVRTGEVEKVWVNTQQHRRHCLFVWEKYQRAAEAQRPMDNWTTDYKHTKHCIWLLRNDDKEFADDLVSSFLTLKYPSCEYGPVRLAVTPHKR